MRLNRMGWAGLWALALGCSEPAPGTLGASCPNDNNCIAPLKCINLTCQMPEEVPDGGVTPPDAGTPDTGVVIEPDAGVVEYQDHFNSGPFAVTPDGTTLGYAALTGRAGLIREKTGYTNVLVFASGLTPNMQYGSHVHAKACEDEAGGGHYKIDMTVMEVNQQNEIWPTI